MQRPLNRASSHASQRSLRTTAEEARSLKPARAKSRTGCSVLKERPSKFSFAYRTTCANDCTLRDAAQAARAILVAVFMGFSWSFLGDAALVFPAFVRGGIGRGRPGLEDCGSRGGRQAPARDAGLARHLAPTADHAGSLLLHGYRATLCMGSLSETWARVTGTSP